MRAAAIVFAVLALITLQGPNPLLGMVWAAAALTLLVLGQRAATRRSEHRAHG